MKQEYKYRALLELSACELSRSIDRHMPPHDYQRYYKWGLSPHNIHQDKWLRLTGLSQLAHLTLKLLDHPKTQDYWGELMTSSIPMNVYQIYEVVSDNLAIGLAEPHPDNNLRRDILLHFNDVVMSRLAGDTTPTTHLLSSSYNNIQTISTFEQSLSLDKHQEMARLYLEHYPASTVSTLEYATWPFLVANIESCIELAHISDQYLVGPMVRQGLRERYQAVNDLIRRVPQNLEQQITASADAILVMPTLAYYIGVLCEKIVPHSHFHRIIEDDSLHNALYSAAVLVRLLNDLGTLVMLSSQERGALITQLRSYAHRTSYETLSSLILGTADQLGSVFTRVHKDALFKEFNLALNDLGDHDPNPTTIHEFESLLDELCRLYKVYKDRLSKQSEHIERIVGTSLVSGMIWHFVTFHETLYGKSHKTATGEYAV